jgi:hypothetical protein
VEKLEKFTLSRVHFGINKKVNLWICENRRLGTQKEFVMELLDMKTKPLTAAEKKWLKNLEDALTSPPSSRIGFYTIGDAELMVYDRSRDQELNDALDKYNIDFCTVVDKHGAKFGRVESACQIHSTAG